MTIEEQIWERIEQGADDEIDGVMDRAGSCKDISMWLKSLGIELLPSGGELTSNWNRADFIMGAIQLQINVIRGHRHFMKRADSIRRRPALELQHGRPGSEPGWLQERWECALREMGPQGAVMSPRVALIHHPVWERLSEIGRPFEPFFPITSEVHVTHLQGVYKTDLNLLLEITPATEPMLDPARFERWADAGRITMSEWLDIFEKRLALRRG